MRIPSDIKLKTALSFSNRERLGELEKADVETLATARSPTAFLVLPNFHSCFYNLIETQYMFSVS